MVIKPADKGSAMVIISKEDYLIKIMDHLDNTRFYKKFNEDPTEWFLEETTTVLANIRSRDIIHNDTFNYLQPKQVWTSRFYTLPKLHKESIPGRPIVSSCGAPTERISQFVD